MNKILSIFPSLKFVNSHSFTRRDRRVAFTLAEVLITLGVIGVVAAITMPTLIQNHRKHFVENKLKADVALFQNALRMAESKHGQLNEWLGCDLSKEGEENYQGNCTRHIFDEYLAPELKVLKVCSYENIEDCWTPAKALNRDVTSNPLIPNKKAISAVLSNGTSFYMWVGNVSSTTYSPHIQLWFDIDGKDKGKNRVGGDVFCVVAESSDYKGFTIYNRENDTSASCIKENNSASAGVNCGSIIQENGWKIPKDYPIKF